MQLLSIQFNYPGSNAINLVDPATNLSLGATPEWTAAGRNVAAAYVAGSTITVLAQFDDDDDWIQVNFNGGSQDNLHRDKSYQYTFTLSGLADVQNAIGIYTIALQWRVWINDGKGSGHWDTFANTSHTIYVTWQPMIPNPNDGLTTAVFAPLVQWSCTWAAGLADAKSICDAAIRNLSKSGLKYGVAAWDIRSMLLQGGGMCAGWAKMFQYIVYSQGVYVHRRAYLVDWRALSDQEVQWAAIVCAAGGLNQNFPPVQPMQFHDDTTTFPITPSVSLSAVTASRWKFWGSPQGPLDGHVINFFVDASGALYLYDPSFGTGPIFINMALPPADGTILGGTQLSSFKSVYLNTAVPYMMGVLRDGQGQLWPVSPGTGITVQTSIIPDVSGTFPEITFSWHEG